ncbi:PREDICTED: prominin-like protein isoform X2 [Nicrophorus vespilloides]|uniref:Prominin-like protein isoform X2 n=1 Tax=Nicrophorus vespilloides TaxID=110193 RepID=A0ABM1NDU5_NICVS|nr:PREDICTED: prominin-like protein isoform X2 [Nicrophorus vespilloides]
MKRLKKRDGEVSPTTTTKKMTSPNSNRVNLNCFTMVLTCTFLLGLMHLTVGERMSNIVLVSRDLNKALMEVLAGITDINYTEIQTRNDYNSSTYFNPRGMAVLYNITTKYIKAISINFLPTDLISFEEDGKINITDDYQKILLNYWPLITFLVVLVAFALFMPICGLCFWCCRCCGNCGATTKSYDKKSDLCKKLIFATLLIGLGTLILFGVVCAFVTNQHMQDGTESLTKNLRISVDDTNSYIHSTKDQINVLLDANFAQFSDALFDTLNNASSILFEKLTEVSKAASIKDAGKMIDTLKTVKANLKKIKVLTNELRVDASQLNDAMRKLKKDLFAALKTCEQESDCSQLLENYVSKLGTTIDFDSIPDMTSSINKLDKDLDQQFVESISKGITELNGIQTNIESKLTTKLDDLKKAVKDSGDDIKKQSTDITKSMDETASKLNKATKKALNVADKYIKEYSKYRFYIGLGVSVVLLLIALCISLGLVCGICGKKASDIDDDCCNKGAGSKFLIIGVAIMFLSAFFLVIVLLAHFIAVVPHRMVCEPMRDPQMNEVLIFLDKAIRWDKNIGLNITLQKMIPDCYNNKSAYHVFNLKEKFDLEKIGDFIHDFQIDELLNQLEKELQIDGVTLLKDEDLDKLQKLTLENNFSKVISELSINFTNVDLGEFSNAIDVVIKNLKEKGETEIVTSLTTIKLHIDTYIEKVFNPMKKHADEVINLANTTDYAMRFGKDSFEEAIKDLVDNIKYAQDYLTNNGTIEIKSITKQFSTTILDQAKNYTTRIIYHFEQKIGDCGPVALVLNGTLTATCDNILAPMNGFWFSIFWCLVLFIPTIIISVKLASVYQKRDQYRACESDYLYDAFDRESVPLARTKANKKKQKKKRGDNRAYMPDRDRRHDYPGGSHHEDTRYADMAPKNYGDFPNGGPPQYERAPTEYERPPPYYYQGSGDH